MRRRLSIRAAAGAGLLLLLAQTVLAADAVGVRVFFLQYKRSEEAALLIRPLLSDSGSILLPQKTNAITVTDRESVLAKVARVIEQFDLPPRGYTFAVKMIRASADASAGSLSREIGGIGNKLREVFRFSDYSLIDSAVLRGSEGNSLSYLLGGEYRLAFRIDPAGEGPELRLSEFVLSRERNDLHGRKLSTPLYRAVVNVALNQTVVIGASKEEGSKNALILILMAQENPRPNSEKGTSGIRSAEAHP